VRAHLLSNLTLGGYLLLFYLGDSSHSRPQGNWPTFWAWNDNPPPVIRQIVNLVKNVIWQTDLANDEFGKQVDLADQLFAKTSIRPIVIWRILTALGKHTESKKINLFEFPF